MNNPTEEDIRKAAVSPDDKEEINVSGYLLFANSRSANKTPGAPWCWWSPDLEFAKSLARIICEGTGQVVRIAKLVGVVQPKAIPTEFVEATDLKK
jgi:hypothetical protein